MVMVDLRGGRKGGFVVDEAQSCQSQYTKKTWPNRHKVRVGCVREDEELNGGGGNKPCR